MMNFVTFGNETINLDNVTHITVDISERYDGTQNPFIRFNFATDEDAVIFRKLNLDDEPLPDYLEVKAWLENLQERK